MRCLVLVVAMLAGCALTTGCESELGLRRDGGPGGDAGRASVDGAVDGALDPPVDVDGGGGGAADDGGPLPTDSGLLDAAGPIDGGGSTCAPTHPACRGELECGAVPNGCPGESIDCGECSGGETYCAVMTARWQTRTWSCVQSVQEAHPEHFDPVEFRDTSSWLVLDAAAEAYVRDVAGCVSGTGATAIPDPGAPGNEIRVRAADDDLAENFIIRTYGTGRTAGRYTSTCTPAMF